MNTVQRTTDEWPSLADVHAGFVLSAERLARQQCAEQLRRVDTWEQVHMLSALWAADTPPCGATAWLNGFRTRPCLRESGHVAPGHDDGYGDRW